MSKRKPVLGPDGEVRTNETKLVQFMTGVAVDLAHLIEDFPREWELAREEMIRTWPTEAGVMWNGRAAGATR